MRIKIFATLGLGAIILVIAAGSALAQEQPMPEPKGPVSVDRKPNMLARLGLSREQVQQIRNLNVTRKPRVEAALSRLREANRALDESIYADALDESDLQARIKEVQNAQSDLIALRAGNESAVRRVLTPDQLALFREMRGKFEQMKEQRQDRRKVQRNRQRVKGDIPGVVINRTPRPI